MKINLRQSQELKDKDTSPERKQFIKAVIAQDNDMEDTLDILVNGSNNLLERNSRGDQVTNTMKVYAGYQSLFAAFVVAWVALIMEHNSEVALLQANMLREKVMDLYGESSNVNVLKALDRFDNAATVYPKFVQTSFLSRKFPDVDGTVGSRIVLIKGESLKITKNILTVGIKNGRSATQIAKDIQQYMKPDNPTKYVSPFQYIREKYGKEKVALLSNNRIPAGSMQSNAIRIARTEINQTYRNATIQLNKGRIWTKGFDWNLSPSHPKADNCDGWAASNPHTAEEVNSFGHPYCMCNVTVDFATASELE